MSAFTTINHARESSDGARMRHDREMQEKGFVKEIVLVNPDKRYKHVYKKEAGPFLGLFYRNKIVLTGNSHAEDISGYIHVSSMNISEYEWQWVEPKKQA